jgi:hypothetical protein
MRPFRREKRELTQHSQATCTARKNLGAGASFHPPFPPITHEQPIVIVIREITDRVRQDVPIAFGGNVACRGSESVKKGIKEFMKRQRRFCAFALLTLLMLAFKQAASAQTAQVTGIITDSHSAAVAGAQVTLTNVDTGVVVAMDSSAAPNAQKAERFLVATT